MQTLRFPRALRLALAAGLTTAAFAGPALAQDGSVDAGVSVDAAAPEPDPAPPAAPAVAPADAPTQAPTQAPALAPAQGPAAAALGAEGVVTDRDSGDPVAGAAVTAVGAGKSARTDAAGKYRLVLPAGTYRLRFTEPIYELVVVDGVAVTAGAFVPVNVQMALDDAAFQEETVIVTRFDVRSAAAQLQARRESAVVKDSISAEEMQRTPDSSAGDSARRVPGASIVGGRYLVVRGLTGRYTNALLNGVRLPSTDPDEPGVQLDLFPGQMLSSLSVAKTFTPDIPGNFAGGSMQLETRDYPEKLTLQATLGTALNSASAFRGVYTYDGGGTDFLGLDDGARALPETIPDQRLVASSRGLSREAVDVYAREFPVTWSLERTTAVPDGSFSGTAGDTVKVAGHKLGLLANVTYGHQWRRTVGTIGKVRVGAGEKLELIEDLDTEVGQRLVTWGGLGSATYELSSTDELRLVAMWNHAADDSARVAEGRSDAEGADIVTQRFRYLERNFGVVQLLGDHQSLPLLGGARLRWQLNGSYSGRDEPDTRDLLRQKQGDRLFWRDVTGSGERLYAGLTQWDGGAGVDLTVPAGALTAKTGGLVQYTERAFSARRFGLQYIGDGAEDRYLPPDQLFAAANVGRLVRLTELTRADDSYQAEQLLLAGYLMGDVKLGAPLRLIGGARAESFGQSLESFSPFPDERDQAVGTDRTDTDLLPSASVVLEVMKDMFVRAAYGGTVARPELRELAPFLFQDFVRRRTVQGNPDLLRTYIHNFDLRWEWFTSETEVLAFSLFYKEFLHPIEQSIRDRQGNITYENVEGASNFGGEVEARVGLGRFHRALTPLSFGGNVALVHSEVTLTKEQQGTATSSERPLAGQSPYVANLSLGCALPDIGLTAFVYYNVFGRRIEEVGKLGLPDTYQEPFHSLDVSVAWDFTEHTRLTANATNLLFEDVVLTQGRFEVQRRKPGATFGLKLAWAY